MTGPDRADAGSTVAAADIARLAGVGRAAVSNWRRRFPDFPEPVAGTAASPLYRLGDVERWLRAHDRAVEVAPRDRAWQRLRSEVDDHALGDALGELGALLVLVHRDPARWHALAAGDDAAVAAGIGSAVAAVAPELPVGAAPWGAAAVGVLREFAELAGRDGAPAVLGFVVERYHEAHARRLLSLPAAVAGIVAGMAVTTGAAVLDPACGTGALLAAAVDAGAAEVLGQDLDPAAARLAGARALLAGAAARTAAGDALRADAHTGRTVDVVLCDPPTGDRNWGFEDLAGDPRWEYGLPPRGEPELAWVQHCLGHLVPGGTAVVVMPPAAAVRRSGRRIRANLLRAGALRAVVAIPPDAGPACDLWVLRRPVAGENPPDEVVLLAAVRLPDVLPAWRDRTGAAVRIVDLLDDEVDLSPARHAGTAGPEPAVEVPAWRGRLVGALTELTRTSPELVAVPTGGEPPTTTIGELAKAGVLSLLQAPLRTETDAGELPVLTVKDVTVGRAASGRTREEPGQVVLRPGDVVVPVVTGRAAAARVVTEGGAVLGPRLLCLRADADRLDPDFLAGVLRTAAAAVGVRTTSGLSRTDTRRVPVPLLPVGEQRVRGAAVRRLTAFQDGLRRCAEDGTAFVEAALAGLVDGRLGAGD